MFNVGDVLSNAWEKFKGNAGLLIGAYLISAIIPFTINFGLSIVLGMVAGQANSVAVSLSMNLVTMAISLVLNTYFMLGLIAISLKVLRGEPAEIGMLFGQADKLIQGLLAMIIITVGVFVGMLLLVVPGILFAIVSSLTLWYVYDKELDAITALKASIEATKPAMLNIFLWFLALFVLSLLCICTLCLGYLILVPVLYLSWGLIYMSLETSAGKAAAV